MLGFYTLKLWTYIVVIYFEFQYFFIANGIGNYVSVQFATKHAGSSFAAQGIVGENRGACKTKLVVLFEFLFKVLLRFTKLGTVCLIEDEDNLLVVYWQVLFAPHQVIEFLDSSNDNFMVVLG